MTFDLPLTQVDAARLDALRADGVREGRQLDYKERLPGNSDDDKKEFLADVTSFANAAGGDLIIGVNERRDANGKATGEIDAVVGLGGLNVDAERLRLESIIRDGVAPRLPPVTVHEIRREGAPSCLLLRIPRSWAGLHMVTFRNLSRFYSRTSGGKYQLDVHEIRAGFLAAETATRTSDASEPNEWRGSSHLRPRLRWPTARSSFSMRCRLVSTARCGPACSIFRRARSPNPSP